MKKVIFICLALIFYTDFMFAQSYENDRMLICPGTFNTSAGFGYSYDNSFLECGSIEYTIGRFFLGEVPFVYGIAIKGGIGFNDPICVFLGGLANLHLCWGAIGVYNNRNWLNNLDTSIGFGYCFSTNSEGVKLHKFNMAIEINYFVSETTAFYVEGGLNASYLGILFRF